MKKRVSVRRVCVWVLLLTGCKAKEEEYRDEDVTANENTAGQEMEGEGKPVSEGAPETEANEAGAPERESGHTSLVVYFSWSGNTKQVANVIANQTGADVFEIVPNEAYIEDYDALLDIAAQEKESGARPAISGSIEDIAQYDVIYVGYPNWWGDMPMIMYTFFDSYDLSGKTVAPFCTSGGSGLSNTVSSIKELEPDANVLDGLHIGSSSASNPDDAVSDWLSSIAEERNIDGNAGTKHMESNTMKITAGDTAFTALLADNSSAEALKELLTEKPLTISMSDYAGMEKVGTIGTDLPRNDEQTTTGAGDIILYQGNSLVIYYGTNSWNFTRIGKIEDVTGEELLDAFGDGDVTVTFSLE